MYVCEAGVVDVSNRGIAATTALRHRRRSVRPARGIPIADCENHRVLERPTRTIEASRSTLASRSTAPVAHRDRSERCPLERSSSCESNQDAHIARAQRRAAVGRHRVPLREDAASMGLATLSCRSATPHTSSMVRSAALELRGIREDLARSARRSTASV
jgi:hypothetical protein